MSAEEVAKELLYYNHKLSDSEIVKRRPSEGEIVHAIKQAVAAARNDERVKQHKSIWTLRAFVYAYETKDVQQSERALDAACAEAVAILDAHREAQPVERISEADQQTLDKLHGEGEY